MRFEELSNKHQEFLMYCLSDYIKGKIKKGTMDGIIFPGYEEFKDFFNEFDEDYEIINGLPESETTNPFSVKLIRDTGDRFLVPPNNTK